MSSMDGSFSCSGGLRRLITRCPSLASDPRITSLVALGAELSPADAVPVLADAFLHPSFSIPLLGCFRPLADVIVSRAVEKLRMVPSLDSETGGDDNGGEEEIGENNIYVVDFYGSGGGRRRRLRLHELACLAFVRALDLSPFLLSVVLDYFKFSPPPFIRFTFDAHAGDKGLHYLACAIRVSYRFLFMEPSMFSELWDWSSFTDALSNLPNPQQCESSTLVLDIRWYGAQILSVLLKMGDRAVKNIGMGEDEALACFLRWEEFLRDTAVEKAGWYLPEDVTGGDDWFDDSQRLESIINFCSSKFASDFPTAEACPREHPFFLTSAVRKSFEMVCLAVIQKWPVLLHGRSGTGKSAMISLLAHITKKKVIFIHMDEQMDSKTLIGSYVCAGQPGEFRWQEGTLTHAVSRGYWVVFENIDKAPSDVHSIILPLLHGSHSFVTRHGEEVTAAESFRLFGTISTSKQDVSLSVGGSALWRKVMLRIPEKDDLVNIVNSWYPNLEPCASRLVDTFQRINSACSYRLGVQSCVDEYGTYCRFSLRDLLKFCRRVADVGLTSGRASLSSLERKRIFKEAVDIFSGFSSFSGELLFLMQEIASVLEIPYPEDNNAIHCYKPVIETSGSYLHVGRATLKCIQTNLSQKRPFAAIHTSLEALERISMSVKYSEPVLLVGETGTGKTTLVQNLATWLGQSLSVVNLSQQSDISDLLGGYKPTDAGSICIPLYDELKRLFCSTFSKKSNEAFLSHCDTYATERNWKMLLCACQKSVKHFHNKVWEERGNESGTKRKRSPSKKTMHECESRNKLEKDRMKPLSDKIKDEWKNFSLRVDSAHKQFATSAGKPFTFVEGTLVTALKKGEWILLDEVNLAPPELLQRIIGILDGEMGGLWLSERGDVDCVECHSEFRIFACMNPATDAGKRELPYSFRSRFTEYFVNDTLDDKDLSLFVSQYLRDVNICEEAVGKVVKFYIEAKRRSEVDLLDGANQKPHFTLRSLARALEYVMHATKAFGLRKALYDGFSMFFLTSLDRASAKIMHTMIVSYLLGGGIPTDIPFDSYFIGKTVIQSSAQVDYILTTSVTDHLKHLARSAYIKKYPVLLQGPTSSGKTSLIRYLASVTGHEFMRINNHEHTDLQEYFGCYITDSHGKLKFQEGVLVKAVRYGYWIVLDELNLAPSDVLESLNRLLDDNRELFIPELQETITAHRDFMLFATQNPPMQYGGRKVLSRAFRNRFVEIHFDEIPEDELPIILKDRSKIPESYAKKMVKVMKDLQLHRHQSKFFAGKHGFITPRDLFRWANRYKEFGKSYEDLAKDGFLLLAERLRDENEKNVVKESLESHLPVKLNIDALYKEMSFSSGDLRLPEHNKAMENIGKIVWTKSMWRLYFILERCYKMQEPVLLVGETGGGKTTVCQLLSAILGSKLHILNCHQYTETSDFIGGYYPVRDRSRLTTEYKDRIDWLKSSKLFFYCGNVELSSKITEASITLNQLDEIVKRYQKDWISHPDICSQDYDDFQQVKLNLVQLLEKWQTLFLWYDGPLVQAMRNGDFFLMDEISLADDSVLERLNSVLEPERKLSLAEKGGPVLETITAHQNFFVLATMNPGGDYGKKELSPALRNRFTEIWVPPVNDIDELRSITAERFMDSETSQISECLLNFWRWFNCLESGRTLTVRDLLSWISFINETYKGLGLEHALVHGAFLVLLDGLSLGTGISKCDANKLREDALLFLLRELKEARNGDLNMCLYEMENYGWGLSRGNLCCQNMHCEHLFGIAPFFITTGQNNCKHEGFEFKAPTTSRNALRVLRAMQLRKPILLEGSPGVGKTSLVIALAEYSGHCVVRINLSEQTDMMDLIGSDLPAEGEKGMQFSWCDGILLQALKSGSWVLLDELNLAPQAVLEGLNAILDHRSEVYIPELSLTFKCPPSFRIFACQNPSSQGSGRKFLPKSFLNRFTKVYVDELGADDFYHICRSQFPSFPNSLLSKLVLFNKCLFEDTMVLRKYAQEGSPWEFNLRDIIRSCQIIEAAPENAKEFSFLNIIYLARMRTVNDRKQIINVYEKVFGARAFIDLFPNVQIGPDYLTVGQATVERNYFQPLKASKYQLSVLPGIHNVMEAALKCIGHRWLCILVGPCSSGKTSLIRLLAQLTGNALYELNLSSGTDVSELLGCFEQYNFFRSYKAVVAEVERHVHEFFRFCLNSGWKNLIDEKQSLLSKWLAFVSGGAFNSSKSPYAFAESCKATSHFLDTLVEIIEQLKHDLHIYERRVSYSNSDLIRCLETVKNLQKQELTMMSGKFEWVSGGLIKAIEHGEWVILENANLCNPTTLDRINSLLEANGHLSINECGLVEGKPMVVAVHPNFRMFFTVDPKYGEVSRAMRNRGVEIYMMEPHLLIESDSNECKKSEMQDVKSFLVHSGILLPTLIDMMCDAHIFAKIQGSFLGTHISLLELTRWVQLFQNFLMNGNQVVRCLHISYEHAYLSPLGEQVGNDIVMAAMKACLPLAELCKLDPSMGTPIFLCGGWPSPVTSKKLAWYSRETSIPEKCAYLVFLSARHVSFKLSTSRNEISSTCLRTLHPSIMSLYMVYQLVFPSTLSDRFFDSNVNAELDDTVSNNILQFAANWSLEQATLGELPLYGKWFEWINSYLLSYTGFFDTLLLMLNEEGDHPFWKSILDFCRVCYSLHDIEAELVSVPVLSSKFLEIVSLRLGLDFANRIGNAFRGLRLLWISIQQWNDEDNFFSNTKKHEMQPLLNSLRYFEKEVLNVSVEQPELLAILSPIIDHHICFWSGLTNLNFDCMSIAWTGLKKALIKFNTAFAGSVGTILMEGCKLNSILAWNFHRHKPLLWAHGGHPLLPSSSEVYYKMQQLLSLLHTIWPEKRSISSGNFRLITDIVLSINAEFRCLAMECVCLLSHLLIKANQHDIDVMLHFEELYQRLLTRLDHERRNVVCRMEANPSLIQYSICACCDFSSEILCNKSGFLIWELIVPLYDKKSIFLDIDLLQALTKCTFSDADETRRILADSSNLLRHALDFSLKFSSRSPIYFSAHQSILWVFDALSSIDSVNLVLPSLVLDIWHSWHSALWNNSWTFPEVFQNCCTENFTMLLLPRTTIIDKILQTTLSIKDYDMECLKLRTASINLWKGGSSCNNFLGMLHSSADVLFRQIIFAHKKAFQSDEYQRIQSILSQLKFNVLTDDELRALSILLSSSDHEGLSSLVEPIVHPLLKELYSIQPSLESLYNIGCAWLYIGVLRFNLLLNLNGPDPALKYTLKYSWLLKKISSLELEIKVRRECKNFTGRGSSSFHDEKNILLSLKELERLSRKVYPKVVFRPEPSKFADLISDCYSFMGFVSSCMELVKNLKCKTDDLSALFHRASNLQISSSSFIGRLSEAYADYTDIIRPIQLAVFEIKLGLSLAVSSSCQGAYISKLEAGSHKTVIDCIQSLMQFPRYFPGVANPDDFVYLPSTSMMFDSDISKGIQVIDANLIEKLLKILSKDSLQDSFSIMSLRARIHHIMLIHKAHHVSVSCFMDKASFITLNEFFCIFVNFWMDLKSEAKAKDDCELQYFKFKCRTVKMNDILVEDMSLHEISNSNGSMTPESEDKLIMEVLTDAHTEQGGNLDEQSQIPESILDSTVTIHDRLFGWSDQAKCSDHFQTNDKERLRAFLDSYKLGSEIIKESLHIMPFSVLDENLLPEHLLRVCLELEGKLGLCCPSEAYNCYKTSNAFAMFEMVKPILGIQCHARELLNEWPDHPGLQRIFDVTEMLLAIPPTASVPKALLGLEVLASRIHLLQEGTSRFPFDDLVQPINSLISKWRKLELEYWPALLDEIQMKYDVTAGKLWLPLFAVLHRKHSENTEADITSTLQSLEEFIQTASVGEFRRRLHLVVAFHGHIQYGINFNVYTSRHMMQNLNILYNVFGYYMQYMPAVSQHVASCRNFIEKELEQQLKLFKWEHNQSCLPIENYRRVRHKIWRLIREFSDMLQQPVMEMDVLKQDEILNNEKIQLWLKEETYDETSAGASHSLNVMEHSNKERLSWLNDWSHDTNIALERMNVNTPSGLHDVPRQSLFSESTLKNIMNLWNDGWSFIEKVCRYTIEFACVLKNGKGNLKKRTFSELLKFLEQCGLSRHKFMMCNMENKDQWRSLFLQPSYNMRHLLQHDCKLAKDGNDSFTCELSSDRNSLQWEAANSYYFKNMVVLQKLHTIFLNFNKDLSLEQANSAMSFLNHLLVVQQEQRYAAYGISQQLPKLSQLLYMLNRACDSNLQQNLPCDSNLQQNLEAAACRNFAITGSCCIPSNQHTVYSCMWLQKHLFDSLFALSNDVCLILERFKKSHQLSCDKFNAEADKIHHFINKFLPMLLECRKSLNSYLLNGDGFIYTRPFIISKEMEELVFVNFKLVNSFEEGIHELHLGNQHTDSVAWELMHRFEHLVKSGKAMIENFQSAIALGIREDKSSPIEVLTAATFKERVKETSESLVNTFRTLGMHFHSDNILEECRMESITSWKTLLDRYVMGMHLDQIYSSLSQAIVAANNLANSSSGKNLNVQSEIKSSLDHLGGLLKLLLSFLEGILSEFLEIHKTVAEICNTLSHLFKLLFSEGFGSVEEKLDTSACDAYKDASGTGMGEGDGINDVSDQIADEAQLIGSEKGNDMGNLSKPINDTEKGIEMDEDFDAETFDISEDSGDVNSGSEEDIDMERRMGEAEGNKHRVDEKPWNEDEGRNPDDPLEKYEAGPSVKDRNPAMQEIRAKDDDAMIEDEPEDSHNDVSDGQYKEEKPNTAIGDETNEMNLDKDDAYEDAKGIQFDEKEDDLGGLDMDEPQGSDIRESDDSEVDYSNVKANDDNDMSSPGDEENVSALDEPSDMGGSDDPENGGANAVEFSKEDPRSDAVESKIPHQGAGNSTVPISDSPRANSELESMRSNEKYMDNNFSTSGNSVSNDVLGKQPMLPDVNYGMSLETCKPRQTSSGAPDPSVRRTQPNPYHSLGDALKDWKERVKISADSHESQDAASTHLEDEMDNEFCYVAEGEKGTSQALGPATSDQLKHDIDGNKCDKEGSNVMKEVNHTIMDSIEHLSEGSVKQSHIAFTRQEHPEELLDMEIDNDMLLVANKGGSSSEHSGDIVSFYASYTNGSAIKFDPPHSDTACFEAMEIGNSFSEMDQKAIAGWKKYEHSTYKLSLELAEQLRLVMEPTLASKLQGDYKTGKRINMKKVIPYIASHFRKDKIWLRRTRPNKREYQVVVAIDDSRSMSECSCGDAAVEALVTVCRAMSQLEVGQLAVTSFGKKGNIKILHNFDESFTGEAGARMISSLSFKQDNTIADEPMDELLQYLNNMLDAPARGLSGNNPLHQLVLIIADGHFHEKENLRRRVRDALNRGRMIAFILVDSPDEPIMDFLEVSLDKTGPSFTKYLNSFPFPYYIILRNKDALPRILGDLLRQWFELTQSTRQ